MSDFGDVAGNTALQRTLHFSGAELGKGGTAPTDVTIGTTPAVPALLFDAVAETASVYTSFFDDMDLGVDFNIVFQWSLVNVQLDADQLDLTIDYVVPQVNSTGSGPDKTSTQILATQQVTTANGLAINDMYELVVPVTFDDATNPFAGGAGIAFEISLTNLTGVAAIHLLDVDIEYQALY